MPTTPFRGKRFLINKRGYHSTAAVVAEIQDTRKWKKGCDQNGKPLSKTTRWAVQPDTICSISDCDRKISLYFDFGDEQDWANNFHKLDKLILAFQTMRDNMEDEHRLWQERIPQLKKEEGE